MLTPKRVVLSVILIAWLGLGVYSGRHIAGGVYLIAHKTSPLNATADTWQTYWRSNSSVAKEKKLLQVSAAVPVVFFLGLPLILFLSSLNKPRSLHGDARWATQSEAVQAGLFSDKGIILGKLGGKYLMSAAEKFLLLIAPTRSGKGVGIIIPNLLNWSGSCIVSDVKKENFDRTSGFRAAHGQSVYKFAPFDPLFETHCWNPLSYVSHDPRFIVGDLQSIGYMIYPKRDGSDSFWNDQARNLFVAISLYCVECGLPLTIGRVLRLASGDGKPKDFWQAVVDTGVTPDGVVLSTDCLSALRQFSGNSENTLTSILASFNAPLGVFSNPLVDAATSSDSFDLRDIFKKKMSIYLVVPPNKLDESALLMNLFFSITYDQNTKVLPQQDASLKYLCLMVQDEFPALGRVDKFVRAVGYLAGYGFRCITVAQSVSQLQSRELYGEEGARTLVSNHMLQVMYAPREQKDAEEYSNILGYTTQDNISKGRSFGKGLSRSENTSDHKRALMMPQELRELGPQKEILISDNCKPILADKIEYFSDPVFASRLLPPVKVARLDLDAFLRQRGESASGIITGNVVEFKAHGPDAMPQVTKGGEPIQKEVQDVANWLFRNVDWNSPDDEATVMISDQLYSAER